MKKFLAFSLVSIFALTFASKSIAQDVRYTQIVKDINKDKEKSQVEQQINLDPNKTPNEIFVRTLGVSKTRKTLLINKGSEDGVLMDQHARFSVKDMFIARGVSVKVSNNRSVWSVYEVLKKNHLVKDRILKLRAIKPVKISDKKSKSLKDVHKVKGGKDAVIVNSRRSRDRYWYKDVHYINESNFTHLDDLHRGLSFSQKNGVDFTVVNEEAKHVPTNAEVSFLTLEDEHIDQSEQRSPEYYKNLEEFELLKKSPTDAYFKNLDEL